MNNKIRSGVGKRGYFFSLDALIALVLIFGVILLVQYIEKQKPREIYIHEDLLSVLSLLKINEFNDSYVEQLKSEGKIRNTDLSILEQIGEFYATEMPEAQTLTQHIISSLDTKENIGLWFDNHLIASRNITPIENSERIYTARQMISGIEAGHDVTGYSSRAFLSRANNIKYFYFGGYIGDGNITSKIDYNGTLKSVETELATNKDFQLYINGNYAGTFTKSDSESIPKKYSIPIGNFNSGSNEIQFAAEKLYIAGGYIKIAYENFGQYEYSTRYYFPGIDGVINLYDGFYIPDNLNAMNINLHYKSPYSIFLNIGNKTVFNGSGSEETTSIINNAELSSILSYGEISKKTIPLRMGLYELQKGWGGNADIVLITDLSGSMDTKLNSDDEGISRDCNDPNLYNSDTKRISLVKCLDKMVIEMILNVSGNRLALSAFYGDTSTPYKGRVYEESLTNNASYLKLKIDNYFPQGGTCICCSINDAYKILNEQSNSNRSKFVIVMSDGIPTHTCQAASGCQGTRTGLPSEEGLWLGWGAGCYGGLDDCNVNDCQCASQNANWSSCRLYNEQHAKVYSIGFGPLTTCQMANNTLQAISQCGKGKYFTSDNATLLEEFYRKISEEIIELSYVEQITNISGNLNKTILYPSSYIEFDYVKPQLPYGLIIASEKQFDSAYSGTFDIPSDSKVLETRVISYSGPRWTDNLKINGNEVYKLSEYGADYIKLGDPYVIHIPVEKVVNGTNTINLTTGVSPLNSTYGSTSNKIIYTIVKEISSYSEIVPKASGCIWNLQFESGENLTIKVPADYGGTDNCYYKPSQVLYKLNDAVDIAVYNLFRKLDLDSDNLVETKFSEQDLQVISNEIVGIPYAWGSEVQVRVWD